MVPDDTFEFFQKSMGSYTVDCQLLESLDGPPIKALPKVRKAAAPKSASFCGASSSTIERYAPPAEDLRRVVMGLVKDKRAALHTRDLWTKLGWAIVNIGRVGGYEEEAIEIFREFSMTRKEAFQEPAFWKVVEDARHDSNLLGWTYIKECHLEDTTVFLDSMSVEDDAAGTSVSKARVATDEAGSNDDTQTTDQPDLSVIKSYAIVKRDFENEFFKLKHPVRVVQVTPDETYYMRLAEVRENEGILTYDETVEEKGVKKVAEKRFFERWWNDKNCRTYDKVDFLPPPLQCPAGVYNLFRGFRAETLPPTTEDVDLEPIFSLMCRLTNERNKPVQERVGFEYLLNWLAHIIQLPSDLPRTAILIQSPQGAGKNVFSSFFGEKVLGEALYLSSAKIDTFFDKFANGLSEKVLCNFNEVKLSLTKSKQDEIKEAITEKKVALEKKGVDRIFVRNCARHLWFSNRMMPIVIEDTDRRWVAFQADSTIPDPDYFTELVNWTEDDRNARAFFEFLEARDISNWNASRDRPRTEFYTELQQMSLSRVDQWLIREIEIKPMPDHWLSATSLAERFNQWQIRFAGPNPNAVSNCYLNPKLKPYFNKGVLFDRSGGTGSYYRFDLGRLQQLFIETHKITVNEGGENDGVEFLAD